jgi:signal transduction histidine kinase
MDNLQKFKVQARNRLLFVLLLSNAVLLLAGWAAGKFFQIDPQVILLFSIPVGIGLSLVLAIITAHRLTQPMKTVWQAVLHIAPDTANMPAPQLNPHAIGAELVANMVSHVYQLASVVETVEKTAAKQQSSFSSNFIANALPLPLILLDKSSTVVFANNALLSYIGKNENEVVGQNLYTVLDMSFGSEHTLDQWLENAKANEPVASKSWERVRLSLPTDNITKQFDLAAYYNRSNPQGVETMLVLFDHTASYSQDDQALSFVALAVHELRTPITLLRGYIEALEEDLQGKLTPELTDFIHKMKASAQGLTAFINNMLNVARVEGDQLTLKLHEETWADIVQTAVNDVNLRGRVRGVELQTEVAPDLPTVGADRVAIYEVLINLIDNAIKYSGTSKQVKIKAAMTPDGMVETTVQDFGVGIPGPVMANLFEKFYRSHRSRAQVGGTGLGLYLSKAIVEAHGGHIWVRSKEGQGSVFGFTVVPYTKLAEEKKTGDNNDISRGAHGWIKNHSLYSR